MGRPAPPVGDDQRQPVRASSPVSLDLVDDADKTVIDRLMQLCLYDAASESPFPVGEDGRYAYDHLDAFWHRPYLIRVRGEIVGFALVIPDCPITGELKYWFMVCAGVVSAGRP